MYNAVVHKHVHVEYTESMIGISTNKLLTHLLIIFTFSFVSYELLKVDAFTLNKTYLSKHINMVHMTLIHVKDKFTLHKSS